MPVFTLPLDSGALPSTSQRSNYLSRRASTSSKKDSPSKKRKRDSDNPQTRDEEVSNDAPPGSTDPGEKKDDAEEADDGAAREEAALDAALTNPLSLTPDEIAQYRLAGLALDQEVPGKRSEGWPHKGLSASLHHEEGTERGDEDLEGDEETPKERGSGGGGRNPHLRMQHLSVLTTILHRNLLEGDMVRAKRAFALLLRAQIAGKPVNLHTSGYWAIGAEILIRDGEQPPKVLGRKLFVGREDDSGDDGDDEEEVSEGKESVKSPNIREAGAHIRWGTAAGLEKAKEYYERLILQHPYRDQFRDRTNALDFWPAMLGCEIYGIQYEQIEALRRVDTLEENEDPSLEEEEDDDPEHNLDQMTMMQDPDAFYHTQRRRSQRKRERLWQMREEIRVSTLVKAEKIAARLDEVMTTPAYADSAVLQRLRGMIALYVGDLSVPALSPKVEHEEEEDEDGRFLALQRRTEHSRGLERKKEERRRAKRAFEVVRRVGGRVDELMKEVGIGEEEEETDDGDGYSREESYGYDRMDI